MRLLILALLFCGFSYGQDVTTIHFNYKWNTKNEYKSLNKLKNTKVQYAYVEDQSDLIKQSINLYFSFIFSSSKITVCINLPSLKGFMLEFTVSVF